MSIKQSAKRYLGDTRLWRGLRIARYHLGRVLRSSRLRRALYRILPKRIIYELLQSPAFYGAAYFDELKDATQESGYGAVYSDLEEFGEVARLAVELFSPERALDIGCARGFQVRALKERGVEAWGIDISEYAVQTAPDDVASRLSVCGCQRTVFPDNHFDLVLLMETLEHIPPFDIDRSIEEARRVCSRFIWATIPSIGANRYGSDGITGGKVPERYIPSYEEGIIDLAPFKHLTQDIHGIPIHGHLIVASYEWWTELFTRHGLVRRGDLEKRVNESITNAREGVWNCYILARAANPGDEKTRCLTENWAWERVEEDLWQTGDIELPAGLHRVELPLRWNEIPARRDHLYRILACGCVSDDGNAVLGMRTLTRRDLPRNPWSGETIVSLPCASDKDRRVRLELRSYRGFKPEPLPAERLTLYTSL